MRWAERDGIGALLRGALCKRGQGRRIADAAVAGPLQAVELDGDAPELLPGSDVADRDAARRRHGDRDLATGVAQHVVAGRVDRRDHRLQGERQARTVLEHEFGRPICGDVDGLTDCCCHQRRGC